MLAARVPTLALVAVLGLPLFGAAQAPITTDAPARWHASGAVGRFLALPEAFHPQYCEETTWGVSAAGRRTLFPGLGVEGSVRTGMGLGGMTCAIPLVPLPPPGSTYRETRYRDGIRESSLVTTGLAVVLDLPASGPVGLRGRAGVHRMWVKRLTAWSVGLSSRMILGGHRLLLGMEGFRVGIPFDEDVFLVSDQGVPVLQSTLPGTKRKLMWVLQLEYEVPIR